MLHDEFRLVVVVVIFYFYYNVSATDKWPNNVVLTRKT